MYEYYTTEKMSEVRANTFRKLKLTSIIRLKKEVYGKIHTI